MRVVFSFSRHSVFFFWVSLEINILAVLPIIGSAGNLTSRERTLKYFITQRIASIIFLFLFLFSVSNFYPLSTALAISIFFKIGIPPFHSWLTRIILFSPYKIIGLILFVQKFIPLHIISNLIFSLKLLIFIILITAAIVLPTLKNLLSLRITIIISAWRNSIWIVMATVNSKIWIVFLFFYGIFLSLILSLLFTLNAQKFSSLLGISTPDKIVCMLIFINLAGLPPFSGFFLKLLLLKNFLAWSPILIVIALLNISLIVLFAYLALTYYVARSNFQAAPLRPVRSQYFLISTRILILPGFPIFMSLTR